MIRGIDVVFIHSPHQELGDWYAETLGLQKGFGDEQWQEFVMTAGSRFALDFTSFPRSVVEKQSVMISFRVEDIKEAVERLAARGVRFYPSSEQAVFDVGPALVATFPDADGNWLQCRSANEQRKWRGSPCDSTSTTRWGTTTWY